MIDLLQKNLSKRLFPNKKFLSEETLQSRKKVFHNEANWISSGVV